LKKEILKTIRYFNFFHYSPNFEEIYTFLEKKTTKKKLKKALKILELNKKIKKIRDLNNIIRYTFFVNKNTIDKYSIREWEVDNYNEKYIFSQEKLNNWRLRLYLKILSFFPQIKLIGLSGSLAMMNANKNDDVDLFIITAEHRMFTARFIAIIFAKIFNIHRSYNKNLNFQSGTYKNKVCLNLFFDEGNLLVPEFKRNYYVAHEVLQMRPIFNKDCVYEKFLYQNNWVFELFPNAKKILLGSKCKILRLSIKEKRLPNIFSLLISAFFNKIEKNLKAFQLNLINRHRTNEIITNNQLWFHPEDFYNKIKK